MPPGTLIQPGPGVSIRSARLTRRRPMHLIDYGHIQDGVLYHGTLSDLDGEPKSTWTYERGGRKVTHDQPLDAATFRSLWNRVGNLDVFKRNRVRDRDRELDPLGTHVITIMFGEGAEPQRAY